MSELLILGAFFSQISSGWQKMEPKLCIAVESILVNNLNRLVETWCLLMIVLVYFNVVKEYM